MISNVRISTYEFENINLYVNSFFIQFRMYEFVYTNSYTLICICEFVFYTFSHVRLQIQISISLSGSEFLIFGVLSPRNGH
jgi:hypothetical protein